MALKKHHCAGCQTRRDVARNVPTRFAFAVNGAMQDIHAQGRVANSVISKRFESLFPNESDLDQAWDHFVAQGVQENDPGFIVLPHRPPRGA